MANVDNLRSRASALRLSHKEIARRAGIDPTTVWRLFAPERSASTLEKVERVIVEEEQAMRERLAERAQ